MLLKPIAYSQQPLTTITTFPKAFFESWLEVFDICPRSGFLIPCISLMWFFSITLVENVVLLSVQYLKISTSNRNHSHLVESWTSILVRPSSTVNLPAGVRSLLSIMGGAIVSPQTIPGVEGLLTVSTRIFLYRLLNRKYKNSFLLSSSKTFAPRETFTSDRTYTFQHEECMSSDLCVGRLHVRNVGVSFREPLETFSTGPAGGLRMRSAVLFRLFFDTVWLLRGAVALLLLCEVDVAAPFPAVFPYVSVLGLRRRVSYVNALQNKIIREEKKITQGMKK